jgi:hypothetical protein
VRIALLVFVLAGCTDVISFPGHDSGRTDSEAHADTDGDADSDTDSDTDTDTDTDGVELAEYDRDVACDESKPWEGPADWSWYGVPAPGFWVDVCVRGETAWAISAGGMLGWWDGLQVGWTALPHEGAGRSVAVLADDDVWVLDDEGELQRWDGESWTPQEVPEPLVGIDTGLSGVVWAISDSVLYRWENGAWVEETSGDRYRALWVGQTVGVLDDEGLVTRLDGERWVVEDPGIHDAEIIRGASEVLWVAGRSEAAWFEDGAWSIMPADPESVNFWDLWTQNSSFAWLFGTQFSTVQGHVAPRLEHWNGAGLTTHDLDHIVVSVDAVGDLVAVVGPDLFGRLVDHQALPTPPLWAVDSVAVASDGALQVTGGRERRLNRRLSATGWEDLDLPDTDVHELVQHEDEFWALGGEYYTDETSLWLDEGHGWVELDLPAAVRPEGMAADGVGGLWTVDTGALNHFDRHSWSTSWLRPVGPGSFWAAAEDALWTIEDRLLAWDGATWTSAANIQDIVGLAGRSDDDVWAVGAELAWRWDGEGWTAHTHGYYGSFERAWAGEDELWAVDRSGWDSILHWDGEDWEFFRMNPHDGSAVLEDLHDVWADGQGRAWAVGYEGEGLSLAYFEDGAWDVPDGGAGPLRAVDGVAPDEVWFGGKQLYRWDGSSIERVDIPLVPDEDPSDTGEARYLAIHDLAVESSERIWLLLGDWHCHLVLYEGGDGVESWEAWDEGSCSGSQLQLVDGEPWVLLDATRILRLRDGVLETVHEFAEALSLIDVHAVGPDEAWAAGDPLTLHVQDGAPSWHDWGATRAVAGVEGAVWLATAEALLRVEGAEPVSYPVPGVMDLWVGAADQALAVGEDGAIHRWDGTAWTAETSGTQYDLAHIAVGGGTAWAAGDCALLRRELE